MSEYAVLVYIEFLERGQSHATHLLEFLTVHELAQRGLVQELQTSVELEEGQLTATGCVRQFEESEEEPHLGLLVGLLPRGPGREPVPVSADEGRRARARGLVRLLHYKVVTVSRMSYTAYTGRQGDSQYKPYTVM